MDEKLALRFIELLTRNASLILELTMDKLRLEAEIKRLRGIIGKHHDIAYRDAMVLGGDCPICIKDKPFEGD